MMVNNKSRSMSWGEFVSSSRVYIYWVEDKGYLSWEISCVDDWILS
jgi:hypothetical protein